MSIALDSKSSLKKLNDSIIFAIFDAIIHTCLSPVALQYAPARHKAGALMPVVAHTAPSGHAAGAIEPLAQYAPIGHTPDPAHEYKPKPDTVHAPGPEPEMALRPVVPQNAPAGHDAGRDAAAPHTLPGGHGDALCTRR